MAHTSFEMHTANLRIVRDDLLRIELLHKRAISNRDQNDIAALSRVHTMQVGIFAESLLRQLIEEPSAFTAAEKNTIWLKKSQDARWTEAVDRAHARANSADPSWSSKANSDVDTIKSALTDQLAPVITDRNKLAHGQPKFQLKSRSESDFKLHSVEYRYNYSQLKARSSAITTIRQIIHLLAQSPPAFRRDFDDEMRRLNVLIKQFDGTGYPALCKRLQKPFSQPK